LARTDTLVFMTGPPGLLQTADRTRPCRHMILHAAREQHRTRKHAGYKASRRKDDRMRPVPHRGRGLRTHRGTGIRHGPRHNKLMRIDHISPTPSNICKRVRPVRAQRRLRPRRVISHSRYRGHLEHRFDGILVRCGCLGGGMRPGLLLVRRNLHRPPDNSGR